MRYATLCAALLLVALPIVAETTQAATASSGVVMLAQRRSQAFLIQVQQRTEVSVTLTLNGGSWTGMHIRGAPMRCTDPNVDGTVAVVDGIPIGSPDTVTSYCGILDPGTYWISVRIESGAAQGNLAVRGARLV